jgi:glycerol-3-phosphate acyltransferase PlsY
MDYVIVIFFSYLFGSIPFGLILTKVFINKDIRKIGSGNIGATNVLRTGNKFIAVLTLIFDISKSFIILYLAEILFKSILNEELLITLFFITILGMMLFQ